MLYWICKPIALVLLKTFFRFKVEGLENLPRKNNFIIAANHASFLDAVVLGAASPRKVYFIASRNLYRINWLRFLLKKFDVLPTGSSSPKAIEYITDNKIVALFPEGGCTKTGELKEFRRGAALLAFKTGRPVIPCAILGTFNVLPVYAKIPKIAPIKVKFGKPQCLLKHYDKIIDDVRLQEGILKIKNSIKEMLHAG